MASTTARRLITFWLAFLLSLALPGAASATVRGGCQVTGNSSSGGSIDLTTATEWHLLSDDTAGGDGTAPGPQTSAQVGAYALGLRLPIASGSGDGSTAGGVSGVSVALYAILGKHFVVAGDSVGKDGGPGCDGEVDIILDDVDALFTIFGGGGLLLAIVALIVLLILARSNASCVGRVLGGLFGAVGGAGFGLAMEQFDIFDPKAPIGLVVLIAALLIGLWTPGMLAHGPTAPGTSAGDAA